MTMARWSNEEAADWRARVGWLVGCNFTPSTAGNQLEMWQEETFDPATIDRELGWAGELGMNVVRVYLHDLVWAADGDAFLDRVDHVLAIAEGHGIAMMPVLLDGVWHPKPALGVQSDPVAHRHNSMWVQSPGAAVLYDEDQWPTLQPYIAGVLGRFGEDARVVAWDLFNEPDQLDRDTLRAGSRDLKAAASTGLLNLVFDWAREVGPSQPLTAGVWEFDDQSKLMDNEINTVMVDRSDIISFHCYEPRAKLRRVIDNLETFDRPLVCTEWLARSVGSTADLLDVFADRSVAAINWGLVDGRTQTRYPWRSWTESVPADEPWFHELLHADGSPYDKAEAQRFRDLTRR